VQQYSHTLSAALVPEVFFSLIPPYTLRKKGTKAVTGAVPFQKVHFCTIATLVVHISTILLPKMYTLTPKMYILGPKIDILAPEMDILATKMYILTTKMYLLAPKM